jgi:hypothetical protein
MMQVLPAKNLRPEVVLNLPYPVCFILKPSFTLNTFFLNMSPLGGIRIAVRVRFTTYKNLFG